MIAGPLVLSLVKEDEPQQAFLELGDPPRHHDYGAAHTHHGGTAIAREQNR